jgi:hypothetical protein
MYRTTARHIGHWCNEPIGHSGDPQLGVSLPAATDGGGLILDVYDAGGAHVTFTKTVTSTGCSGQYLC